MINRKILTGLFVSLFFVQGAAFSKESKSYPALDLQISFLASGDPMAGREAFVRYQCNDCHRVLGDSALRAPLAATPAPVLGGLNKEHSVQDLAEAILLPSHSFAPGFKSGENGLSPMGDMRQALTVQAVADIIAYLKTSESLDAPWPKEQNS